MQTQHCVVATAGFFSTLTAGHVDFLQRCKVLGDTLVVCLNSTESIRRLRGDSFQCAPTDQRKFVLESLSPVDLVFPFDDDDPCRMLEVLKPQIYVKGAEYKDQSMPEEELVRSWGGIVVYLNHQTMFKEQKMGDELAALGYTHA